MNIKLIDPRKLITIELPSFPGSQVSLYTSLLFGQQSNLVNKFKGKEQDAEMAIEMLLLAIKSWNFEDESGAPLTISKESLNLLPLHDILALQEAMTGKEDDSKKK